MPRPRATGFVPVLSSFPLGSGDYQGVVEWTITGQTDDPLASFGVVAGSQTYSTPAGGSVLGPAFWLGYNPEHLAEGGTATTGAIGLSCFGDAGDTDVNGRHGLEFNPACFISADGTAATNAIQVGAVDDNSNSVNLVFRCGTGTEGTGSRIQFGNADGSVSFGQMNGNDTLSDPFPLQWYQSMLVDTGDAPARLAVKTTGANSAVFTLAADRGQVTKLEFLNGSANVPLWTLASDGAGNFFAENAAGWPQLFMQSGASDHASVTYLASQVVVTSSLVIGLAELAAAATDGFAYLPACAGPPTGVPSPHAGTAAAVIDRINAKLWVWCGTAWKGAALS
jgi:hypothetical protein